MLSENLYMLEYKDKNKAVIRLSDKNHPVFKAHFPAKPILPGFMNFEMVSEIFEIEITAIKKAKFLKVALPEQVLTYEKDNNKFKVFCDDEEIANFIL